MHTLLTALIGVCCVVAVSAQQIRPLPSSRIYGKLQQLRSMTSVLYVAAHPDDENTRLLSWLANGRNIRTGYLSLTRGDGGQNIIGSEQGAALGLIRTQELLAARRLDGAEQFFSRALDFGFSKNPKETFQHWDSVILIADVVRVIREFRPDVVICRFPKDSMAGHGQHSASAIITEEAVRYCYGVSTLSKESKDRVDSILRSNPNVTGEELWKPKRLLFNAFRFGNRSTIKPGMFKIDVGQYDPLLGMGYGELAGISRSIHRSQGAGTPSTPGVQPEYFETLVGDAPQRSLFDGIDTTWSRIGAASIGASIDSVITKFDMLSPNRSLNKLLDIRAKINEVRDPFWNQLKIKEIDKIITSCIGLTADLSVPMPIVTNGDTARATMRFTSRAGRPVTILPISLPGGAIIDGFTTVDDSTHVADARFTVPDGTGVSQPYWLEQDPTSGLFRLSSELLLGSPVSAPVLDVPVIMSIGYETFVLSLPVSFKKLDPLKGDVIEELRTVPVVSLEPTRTVVHQVSGKATISFRIRAYGNVESASLLVQDGERTLARRDGIRLRAQTDTLVSIDVSASTTTDVRVGLRIGSVVYNKTVVIINYDHIPTLQYLQPATVRVISEPIKVAAKKVAYLSGAGETTPEFMRGLGVVVDEITEDQLLRTAELLSYDALVLGIRVVNTRKSMKYLMPSLLRYVEQGGTLVMQYNTLQDLSTTDIAPFPLTISRNRVTEEDAEVSILVPRHRLLQYPNRITTADFGGWVQERSVYNPGPYDAKYIELLEMHDTGEMPQRGTLLHARFGKGNFVYTSLSLFRQLPAGVVGAMKLMANMLSMKHSS
jgi:LmbE family N-acetylglucosaminyl deacetylase